MMMSQVQWSLLAEKATQKNPEENAEGRDLSDRSHEPGHHGGRPFVNVGSPHMERSRRNLEGETDHSEDHSSDHHRLERSRILDEGGEPADRLGPRGPVEKGNSIKEDGGGEGSQKKVLEGGFDRPVNRSLESHQDIKAQGHQLDPQEQGDQVARRDHDHHSDGGKEKKAVVLPDMNLLFFKVGKRKEDGDDRSDIDRDFEEVGEGIDDVESLVKGETFSIKSDRGDHREKQGGDREEPEPGALFPRDEGLHQQKKASENSQVYLWHGSHNVYRRKIHQQNSFINLVSKIRSGMASTCRRLVQQSHRGGLNLADQMGHALVEDRQNRVGNQTDHDHKNNKGKESPPLIRLQVGHGVTLRCVDAPDNP